MYGNVCGFVFVLLDDKEHMFSIIDIIQSNIG